MFCISVSYQKTPLPIRQKFSFAREEQHHFLQLLKEKELITGGIIISTCNRSEVYITTVKQKLERITKELASYKQITEDSMKQYCLIYGKKSAVRHLYKVTSGLDSMVIGEDEILRQVKEAYQDAVDLGYTNGELNIIFQGALYSAKQAKTKTKLSTTPLSIGTLTANAIECFLKQEENTDFNQKLVLVIGATGKIGSIVTKDLIAKGISVIGTSRRRPSCEEEYLPNASEMIWVDFKERYRYINEADAIVSATTSPHYIITVKDYEREIEIQKPRLFIDLAVPYDIDHEMEKQGNVILHDIDFFKTLSSNNQHVRMGEVEKALHLLEEGVEDTCKKVYIREFKWKMQGINQAEYLSKMIYYLKETLSSDQLKEVLDKIYEKEKGNP